MEPLCKAETSRDVREPNKKEDVRRYTAKWQRTQPGRTVTLTLYVIPGCEITGLQDTKTHELTAARIGNALISGL